MENFDDIRPYKDSEVTEVIDRLLQDNEFFNAVSGFKFPRLKKIAPSLANSLVKGSLKKKLGHIKTIAEVQEDIVGYLKEIIKKTSTGLSEYGLSELPKDSPHLFISNHRDIVMDPALVSYLLQDSTYGTTQIAIGDNLLKKDFVSNLMRLNKSFIVKRSVQGREKLLASQQLSEYMNQAISNGSNLWIAQREGRAKDGLDKTDPAILKMLHIANRNLALKMSLKDTINKLHIVPISISYEYDPCAELKARELFEIDKTGSFQKNDNSDIVSISQGMNGKKGNIHVSFGTEINAEDDDPANIALQIDRQIILNYKLHASNYLAYEKLQRNDPSIGSKITIDKITEGKRQEFENIYETIEEELKPYFLKMYANPIISKMSLNASV